jgi:hypothetical protein
MKLPFGCEGPSLRSDFKDFDIRASVEASQRADAEPLHTRARSSDQLEGEGRGSRGRGRAGQGNQSPQSSTLVFALLMLTRT